MVVGARALAFLRLGVGVACGDMKDKELKLEEIAVSHTLGRQYRKRDTIGWKEDKQKMENLPHSSMAHDAHFHLGPSGPLARRAPFPPSLFIPAGENFQGVKVGREKAPLLPEG